MIVCTRPAGLFILVVALGVSSCVAHAETTYWVLGSYTREAGARSEQLRIGTALQRRAQESSAQEKKVLIARYERGGAPLFRVIVDAGVPRDLLLTLGIEPWAMRVDAARIVGAPPVAGPVEARSGRAPASEPPVIAAPSLPEAAPVAPGSGESYASHCETAAPAARDPACDSDAYRKVKAARARLEAAATELARYCRQPEHAAEPACSSAR